MQVDDKIIRGMVYWANLNPTQGSEQEGNRPVIIVQATALNLHSRTVIIIPTTSVMKWSRLPTTVVIPKGEGGLLKDSVALCHQIRVIDKSRLDKRLGLLRTDYMERIEAVIKRTLAL